MILVVGLGNPGAVYADTRHNIGFKFLDALALLLTAKFNDKAKFLAQLARTSMPSGLQLLLAKPQTYMNNSGLAVAKISTYYGITPAQILVVHDDLQLSSGTMRLKHGGGSGGHNGLRSLSQHLQSDNYYRIRVGISRPIDQQVVDYVLDKLTAIEQQHTDQLFQHLIKIFPELLTAIASNNTIKTVALFPS